MTRLEYSEMHNDVKYPGRYSMYRRLVWTGAENLALTRTRSPDRPARSESLYGLSYPGSRNIHNEEPILAELRI
jgi:hypothetical protein